MIMDTSTLDTVINDMKELERLTRAVEAQLERISVSATAHVEAMNDAINARVGVVSFSGSEACQLANNISPRLMSAGRAIGFLAVETTRLVGYGD
jgi:uncharacterized protein with PIN domain